MSQFLMAGGGTGGHVIPAIAVANELQRRGHECVFLGTRRGLESKLVPAAGYALELVEIGGLNRVGWRQQLRTLLQFPRSIWQTRRLLQARQVQAVFSMGGYVAGPAVLAAWWTGVPVVLMEPNAIPGWTNRYLGRMVKKALINFQETARFFPAGRTELTGLPVRREFFALPPRPAQAAVTVLITGGSRGARTLNQAARASWPFFAAAVPRLRIVLQTGADEHAALAAAFAVTGLPGAVVPFLSDMPAAFADADIVVGRAGAGAVAELAAAGKPAILIPFPFATDNHQFHNAQALARVGAARLVENHELTGERLFQEVVALANDRAARERMGQAVRQFAYPQAAERAAAVLESAR